MNWTVDFKYKDISGKQKVYTCKYGTRKNISDIVFNRTVKETNQWFENEIFEMVDDCEKLVGWEIYEC